MDGDNYEMMYDEEEKIQEKLNLEENIMLREMIDLKINKDR